MNTKNILDFIANDPITKKDFIGVFARDQIPSKIKWPSSLIVNTDNINKYGEHWLAFYFLKNGNCYFFDPLGFSPKYHNFENFIKKNCIIYYFNDQRIQGLLSKNCGYFCCLFLNKLSRNFSFKHFLKLFFKEEYFLNDKLVDILKANKFFL
jgi:hypothetical protein